ncbi:NAD(+)/NADH kinase [Dactylosporangium sp. AC04546]|uniref:NAD(+)/NADH kinase n=1 Tax=Dactylosporangium sp. AC04546 TaxID=2862460 RepID=UPI001EDCC4E8|nr:NAD(+)/NADH kinase [Dactylosporangium sp. AC04546]WVK79549.1 NAD(+)/NADH kinase [Dactylosporangium sp. AC04546]
MIDRIGLVVHGGRPAAVSAAGSVRRWAEERAIQCVDIDVWDSSSEGVRLRPAEEAARAGDPGLIVTVGGDGTFLRGVRVAAAIDAMVLGVDVGRVGFLTEVEANDVAAALDAVHAGQFAVDPRLTLTMRASRPLEIPSDMQVLLRYGRGPALPPPQVRPSDATQVGWGVPLDVVALNDVVFEKLVRDRQASLAVYVSGRLFASYSADALIIATSTGSTAYSFAAGGPIVSPHLDALIFTPVAPHMVFNRSLVLAARDQRVAVRVLDRSGQVAVTLDGQLRGVLDPGDWVSVYAGPHRAKLVRLAEHDFLGRVRDRFRLADAPAALADGSAPLMYSPTEPLPQNLRHPGPPDIH